MEPTEAKNTANEKLTHNKENTGKDFFSIGFNTGGRFNTIFQDFYKMDQQYSLFRNPGINQKYIDMPKADFSTAITKENPFQDRKSVV